MFNRKMKISVYQIGLPMNKVA